MNSAMWFIIYLIIVPLFAWVVGFFMGYYTGRDDERKENGIIGYVDTDNPTGYGNPEIRTKQELNAKYGYLENNENERKEQ